MSHYICTGTCGGVSEKPGVCETPNCPNHGKPLVRCNCKDPKHIHDHEPKDDKMKQNDKL